MQHVKKHVNQNLDILLLVAGTVPMTYQYLTGLDIPVLVYVCTVFAAVSLEVVLFRQVHQGTINIWSTLSLIISTFFLVLIALASYLPNGLYESGVIPDNTYILLQASLQGTIHSVFAVLILCVTMSKQYANRKGVQQHIQEYTKQVQEGHVCTICGKVYKTPAALKAHMTRVHST